MGPVWILPLHSNNTGHPMLASLLTFVFAEKLNTFDGTVLLYFFSLFYSLNACVVPSCTVLSPDPSVCSLMPLTTILAPIVSKVMSINFRQDAHYLLIPTGSRPSGNSLESGPVFGPTLTVLGGVSPLKHCCLLLQSCSHTASANHGSASVWTTAQDELQAQS